MLLRIPRYYEQFRCIGGRCTDNCCIGWEIDIDEQTAARYAAERGAFGERLRQNIEPGEPACFRLGEGERCPFLNGNNLCDIILTLGEDALCQICTDHPRFTDSFGTLRETGAGLCCEEAGRLLFSDAAPFSMLERSCDEQPEGGPDADLLARVSEARQAMFDVLADRSRPLGERFRQLLAQAMACGQLLDEEQWDDWTEALQVQPLCPEQGEKRTALLAMLDWLAALEPISDEWTDTLQQAVRRLQDPAPLPTAAYLAALGERVREYEQLTAYLLFRYLLKASYDGRLLPRVQFAVFSCLIVGLFDVIKFEHSGEFTLWDRILSAKLYSKQMEYSEENMEAALDAAELLPLFAPESLSNFF